MQVYSTDYLLNCECHACTQWPVQPNKKNKCLNKYIYVSIIVYFVFKSTLLASCDTRPQFLGVFTQAVPGVVIMFSKTILMAKWIDKECTMKWK